MKPGPKPKSRPKLPTVKPAPGVKRTRGRPPVAVTEEIKLRVEEMLSVGMTHIQIGAALGVSDDWLQIRLKDALANGAARRRAEVVGMLYASARKGNIAAIKHLDLQTGAAAAQQDFTKPEAPPRKLGKKEQAHEDALKAGADSDWDGLLHTGEDRVSH